ncbi:hypothetical protein LNP18_06195 [Leuconostoc citreum]|uniref:hypothetical protein n=1 Tax=Leuconostoc citreum TaxID=33964 RepID=UPI00200AE4D3|nr:hypothetical protein [Leuconostoc citreum]MCK8605693.1 hypothetical protein [Leuconostoc citreum]
MAKKKVYEKIDQVMVDGKWTYPGLAEKIFNDELFGPRIKRRLDSLIAEHSEGLTERGHDWYFGYLVCAYTQRHYGINTLLNFPTVTREIFFLCVDAYDE